MGGRGRTERGVEAEKRGPLLLFCDLSLALDVSAVGYAYDIAVQIKKTIVL